MHLLFRAIIMPTLFRVLVTLQGSPVLNPPYILPGRVDRWLLLIFNSYSSVQLAGRLVQGNYPPSENQTGNWKQWKWKLEMENGNGQNLMQMNARVKLLINDHLLKTTSVQRPLYQFLNPHL